jgi:hypothetical protein
MILKVFLGGVIKDNMPPVPLVLLVVGNPVEEDTVAVHPTPVNPKAEVKKIPIVANNTRLQRAAIVSCFILPPPSVRASLKVRVSFYQQ